MLNSLPLNELRTDANPEMALECVIDELSWKKINGINGPLNI